MTKRQVFLFWGVMDSLTLMGFVLAGIIKGRVSFYDDVRDFYKLSSDHGWYAGLFFGASLILYLSLLSSLLLFFSGHRLAKIFAYIQVPFRLLLAVPSITLFSWLSWGLSIESIGIIVSLKILSEAIKVLTLHYVGKSKFS